MSVHEAYDEATRRFYEAMWEMGRNGEPFDPAKVEDAADFEGVDLNDLTYKNAKAKYDGGVARSLEWTERCVEQAGAVTSGGTKVLLTRTDGSSEVTVQEVTPDGTPWRTLGTTADLSSAIDAYGLRAP